MAHLMKKQNRVNQFQTNETKHIYIEPMVKKPENLDKKFTGLTYCEFSGHGKNIIFFINKKYGNQEKTMLEWGNIFEKEGLKK